MQPTRTAILVIPLAILVSVPALRAEMTRQQEALTIAENYISLILTKDGDWGGSAGVAVASIQEFKRGERTLGYFCEVDPQGFIVVSLHKELAPVKAYSVDSILDPELDVGMTDVVKVVMERILDAVEAQLGGPIDPATSFDELLEISYRPAWNVLVGKDFDPSGYYEPPRSSTPGMNYQQGEVLLQTSWRQSPPFNDQCPYPLVIDPNTGWPVEGRCPNASNGRQKVGCVATAAAQIMYHWRWPPYGEGDSPYDDFYDWPSMCLEYNGDGAGWWNDPNGVPVTQEQIDAVAELGYEIGIAADMDYGCYGSGASHSDMEDAYQYTFRYSLACEQLYRDDYSSFEWYDLLKEELNENRPVQWGIPGHSLVCDGWDEEQVGGELYWYHLNYGWSGGVQPDDPEWDGYTSSNAWFALDAHPGGDTAEDDILRRIYPKFSIGGWMEGYYDSPSPVGARYFDQDASGENATFEAGIWFQALEPGLIVANQGTTSDAITFNGAPGAESIFLFYGNVDTYTRIRIKDGAIKLRGGGEMVIY